MIALLGVIRRARATSKARLAGIALNSNRLHLALLTNSALVNVIVRRACKAITVTCLACSSIIGKARLALTPPSCSIRNRIKAGMNQLGICHTLKAASI
jgi:hypothetical protein